MKPNTHLKVILLATLLACGTHSFSQTTIFPTLTSWKYLDNGTNQGTAWRAVGFNDATWASGNAELGYGDGGEITIIGAGCTPVATCSPKYITTYFRKTFTITGLGSFVNLTLSVVRDDGIVIFVNGVEVDRDNMPGGTVNFDTPASSAIGGAGETTPVIFSICPSYFLEGSTKLTASATFHPVASNIASQDGTTTHTHLNAADNGLYFYRVRVE